MSEKDFSEKDFTDLQRRVVSNPNGEYEILKTIDSRKYYKEHSVDIGIFTYYCRGKRELANLETELATQLKSDYFAMRAMLTQLAGEAMKSGTQCKAELSKQSYFNQSVEKYFELLSSFDRDHEDVLRSLESLMKPVDLESMKKILATHMSACTDAWKAFSEKSYYQNNAAQIKKLFHLMLYMRELPVLEQRLKGIGSENFTDLQKLATAIIEADTKLYQGPSLFSLVGRIGTHIYKRILPLSGKSASAINAVIL